MGKTDQPTLVDPAVSTAKLETMLQQWTTNQEALRKRGWFLLSRHGLVVDVAFVANVALSTGSIPIIVTTVSIDYTNYDLWAPSISFIHPSTRERVPPQVRALVPATEGIRDLLVDAHPSVKGTFVCLPGTREYHNHPQHSGDLWTAHKERGAGNLINLCDVLWRAMARNVLGLRVTVQTLPPPVPSQADIRLIQGDIDALAEEAAEVSAGAGASH